ncbi:glycosyltransferase family 4 protein [uncultured Winogradskyella sp.]|uniref:glycosyltransferase family 4 protein n=1 Tax=uncultured Winogradskyella sp. TaxID=395353 RepID=UPI00262B03FD|nr:glycosyltransferase family 4 protein [uncultured Winogradskyella sp.]
MKKVLVDVNYFHFKLSSVSQILKKTQSAWTFLNFLPDHIVSKVIYRATFNKKSDKGKIDFTFFKTSISYKLFPAFSFHQKIKKLQPDYILIHGLGYSLNAVFLRYILPDKVIIILQAHGYAPAPKGLKRLIYTWTEKHIDAFLFTGKDNAKLWVDKGIFDTEKIYEVMEGATTFTNDYNISRNPKSFLWVGRLNKNKDPITVVHAFSQFLQIEPKAKLTMIYHTEELLTSIKALINNDEQLKTALTLKGKVAHQDMEGIYRLNEFFILGSHAEGSGYALHEAMACGCIPVVTHIAPFRFMTNDGHCGLLFKPSDVNSCFKALKRTKDITISTYRKRVLNYVESKLSPSAIASDILATFQDILEKKQL